MAPDTTGKRPLTRIAILKADNPVFGDYFLIFGRLLNLGAKRLGIPESDLETSDYDVTADDVVYPKLEDIDAILITGSSMRPRLKPIPLPGLLPYGCTVADIASRRVRLFR